VKTVIDVGCARYGGDYSVERLIDMFRPDVLIGFDPAKDVSKAMPRADVLMESGTNVVLRREAAWTYDGQVRFMEDGLNGQIGSSEKWPLVACIDLARFIRTLPEGELILKLDAEGAEYELLRHLVRESVDTRLSQVLVEWHYLNDPALVRRRQLIERSLTCPIEEWRW